MLGQATQAATRELRLPPASERQAPDPLDSIVGRSPAMEEVKATLRALSAYSINLLLTGPTGTGKILLSRLYH